MALVTPRVLLQASARRQGAPQGTRGSWMHKVVTRGTRGAHLFRHLIFHGAFRLFSKLALSWLKQMWWESTLRHQSSWH